MRQFCSFLGHLGIAKGWGLGGGIDNAASLIINFFRVGKDNKRWKMTARRMWRKEQHTFVDAKNAEKFERMFSNEIKRARYIHVLSLHDTLDADLLFNLQTGYSLNAFELAY